MRKRDFDKLEPLPRDQLWPARREASDKGEAAFGNDYSGRLRLHPFSLMPELTAKTPFKDYDRLRWLAVAAARPSGKFMADIEFEDFIGQANRLTRLAADIGVATLRQAAENLTENSYQERNRRYVKNMAQLNAFIRERGDIYVSYGPATADDFYVAKLEAVSAIDPIVSPADGRKYPAVAISGQDGTWGKRPSHLNIRQELLEATVLPVVEL